MDKVAKICNLVKLTAIAIFMGMAIASCSPKPSEPEQEATEYTSDETPVLVNDDYSYETFIVSEKIASDREQGPWNYTPTRGAKKGGDTGDTPLDVGDYEIRLGVTKTIKIDSEGRLRVRIGLPENLPEMDTTEVYNALFVAPSVVGVYARVTPDASDFIVAPDGPQIVRVIPEGQTSALFTLTPKKLGGSTVSAKVEFFSTTDFSLIVSPQWTNTLSVNVVVDSEERKENRIEELWNTIWNGFKVGFEKFWEAFVALFFGALLFVIRKFIKKKTGYRDVTDEAPTQETPSTLKEIEVGEEDNGVLEPKTPSAKIKEASESDDDDYDD